LTWRRRFAARSSANSSARAANSSSGSGIVVVSEMVFEPTLGDPAGFIASLRDEPVQDRRAGHSGCPSVSDLLEFGEVADSADSLPLVGGGEVDEAQLAVRLRHCDSERPS